MTCIKTGFHGYVVPYDEYVYGDAFAVDCRLVNLDEASSIKMNQETLTRMIHYHAKVQLLPVYCFRIVTRSKQPIMSAQHFTIYNYDQWWDKGEPSEWDKRINSTMFSADVTDHGYSGKLIL